jgi:adenylate cyclase
VKAIRRLLDRVRRRRPGRDGLAGPAAARPLGGRARLGIGVVAAVLGLLCLWRPPGFDFVELLELKLLDWHVLVRGRLAAPADVTVVGIDESSLDRIGRWPWPRTRTAELIGRLTEGGARVIALDIVLDEPDQNSTLGLARELSERYQALGLARAEGGPAEFRHLLEEALATADTDQALTGAIAASRRVVVPYVFLLPPAPPTPIDDESHRLLNRSQLIAFASPSARHALEPKQAASVLLPLDRFHAVAAGAGHVNIFPDRDGALRQADLVLRYRDGLFPSFVLEMARLGLGLPRSRVRLTEQQRLELGPRSIATDENGVMHLSFYGPRGTFRELSAADVLTDARPPAVAGHYVLVGFTAYGLMDVRPTPWDPVMPGVEIHATTLANLLEGRGLRRLAVVGVVEALVVVALAVAWPFGPPRLGPAGGTAVALVLAAGLGGASHLAFRAGTWVLLLPPLAALAVAHVGSVTYQVLVEERERRWIKRAFQQYVPAEVVETVAVNPAALAFGGERRHMTVLFSDIRGYTTFSERHAPEEVVAILHEYLTAMVDVVFRHRGTLDKFIGDAVMAVWGAPLADPDHALNACRAAVEMNQSLERLNAKWQAEGRESLEAGIGIASGDMVVGNLGSDQRFAYTVMGDHVNLAARLEGLNKDYKTERHIIVSEGTYAAVSERVVTRPLGAVTVKGKLQSVQIYELVDVTPDAREERT